nr:hypothetical protein [Gammaproteobacteria bacterium]
MGIHDQQLQRFGLFIDAVPLHQLSQLRSDAGPHSVAQLDLAGGAQPMTDASGDLVVVYNGEIYNFAALRREHEEIARLIRELVAVRDSLVAAPTRQERRTLQRALYGLHALVRLHFAKEEEIYLPLLASAVGEEEAARLADVIAVAKRTGGDMAAIVRSSAALLGEKMEVEREIAVMTAGKRFESRLMMAAPFAFVLMLTAMAPEYMAPLYGSAAGYLILTGGLAALAGCAWLIRKIM